jgi:hypothetical protein
MRRVAIAEKNVGEVFSRDRVRAAIVALEEQAELGVLVAVCPDGCVFNPVPREVDEVIAPLRRGGLL